MYSSCTRNAQNEQQTPYAPLFHVLVLADATKKQKRSCTQIIYTIMFKLTLHGRPQIQHVRHVASILSRRKPNDRSRAIRA